MLDPITILEITEQSEKLASELHSEILNAVVERIAYRLGQGYDYVLTASDKWAIESLEEAGYLLEDIQKIIAKRTGLTLTEVRKAFRDAGVATLTYDDEIYKAVGLPVLPIAQSPNLIRLLERGYNATKGEWYNYTMTTALSACQDYVKACDWAYNMVASGAMTYSQACDEAVKRVATKGVVVEYPSGHKDTLETATVRAVRTGISQASGQVTAMRANEMGITCFLTSSHLGARPTHEPWQGKVFWVDWVRLTRATGIEYPNTVEASEEEKQKYDEFVQTTEIGTVTGLCGANCRHSFGPWIEGVSYNPYKDYNTVENRIAYEKRQKEKAFQNKLRKQRRIANAVKEARDSAIDAEAKEELNKTYQKEYAKLEKYNRQYQDWLDGEKSLTDRQAERNGDGEDSISINELYKDYKEKFIDTIDPRFKGALTEIADNTPLIPKANLPANMAYETKTSSVFYNADIESITAEEFSDSMLHEHSHAMDFRYGINSRENDTFLINIYRDMANLPTALQEYLPLKGEFDANGRLGDILSAMSFGKVNEDVNGSHPDWYWNNRTIRAEFFAEYTTLFLRGCDNEITFAKKHFPDSCGWVEQSLMEVADVFL